MQPFSLAEGSHPIDAEAEQSGLLSWLVPAWSLLWRQFWVIAPFAVGLGGLFMLLPHLSFADRSSLALVQMLDGLFSTLCVALLMTSGYAFLARSEGQQYGLGELQPPLTTALRLLQVVAAWTVLLQLLAWLMSQLLALLMQATWAQHLMLSAFSYLGLWSLVLLFWLFSPLGMVVWVIGQLSQILCVRSDLSVIDVLRTAIYQVMHQLGRLLLPTWFVVGMLILFLRGLATYWEDLLPQVLLRESSWSPLLLAGTLTGLVVLPLSFVIERAYVPWAGRSDALSPPAGTPPGRPLPSRPARTSAPPSTEEQLQQIQAARDSGALGDAAQLVCTAIRSRQRSKAEVHTLLDSVQDWAVLGPALSQLTAEFVRNNRGFEAIWLTEYGQARDPAFLSDQPDQVVVFAKRLTQTERPDLAMKLLIQYVRANRSHAGFLNGALLLARLLMTHANNPDAARKLLLHIQPLYPQEMQIDQLLRQLG